MVILCDKVHGACVQSIMNLTQKNIVFLIMHLTVTIIGGH